jgi:hypothetical protein
VRKRAKGALSIYELRKISFEKKHRKEREVILQAEGPIRGVSSRSWCIKKDFFGRNPKHLKGIRNWGITIKKKA